MEKHQIFLIWRTFPAHAENFPIVAVFVHFGGKISRKRGFSRKTTVFQVFLEKAEKIAIFLKKLEKFSIKFIQKANFCLKRVKCKETAQISINN